MQIFENFLKATSTERQNLTEDAIVMPGHVGSIPKITMTQNIMIDSQFKFLEDYANGYNVLKTCIETNSLFRDIISDHKLRTPLPN